MHVIRSLKLVVVSLGIVLFAAGPGFGQAIVVNIDPDSARPLVEAMKAKQLNVTSAKPNAEIGSFYTRPDRLGSHGRIGYFT